MEQCCWITAGDGFVFRSLVEWLKDFFPNRHTVWRDLIVEGDYEDRSS